MQKVLTNDFSWSKSRHEKLQECRRAYYLHYYASWGGWELDAPERQRQLYILKKLSNRHTWIGSLVHEGIKGILTDIRYGRPINAEETVELVHRRMQRDYRHSMHRSYWREKGRREFTGLMEHEYAESVQRTEWKASWEAVRDALGWFLRSPWLDRARALRRDQWLEVDETFESANFALDGIRVFAIPDFAYVDDDGTAVVVDWKTGKGRDGYDAQVTGYALYISQRYGLPLERLRAKLVYVNDGTEQPVSIDTPAVEAFMQLFRRSVESMRGLLRNPAQNVPESEDAFPLVADTGLCRRCVFRRVCGRDGPVVLAVSPVLEAPALSGVPPATRVPPPPSVPAIAAIELPGPGLMPPATA